MSKNSKILMTAFFILLVFIFFSLVLFNKSEIEKQDLDFSKGRVISNINVEVIDINTKQIKQDKLYNFLKKDKTNIIHFWASWCSTCIKENKNLKEYINNNNINLVSIIYKDDVANIDFKNIKNLYQFNINDPKGFIGLEFGVSGVPENFILDDKGAVIKHIVGNINSEDLK